MKKLFEYVVIYQPKENSNAALKQEEDEAKILVPRKEILADSAEAVTLLAAREIPQDYVNKISQIQVAVRPF